MSDAEDAAHQDDTGNWHMHQLQQLIDRVEHYASIWSRGSGLLRSRCTCISQKLDWDLVKFEQFSAEACKQQWEHVLTKVGKIRTTKELIDNAAVWLRKPVQKRGHSELPKKPLTVFMQFSKELAEELKSKHPAASAADIARMVNASYKELSESRKAELKEQYQHKLAEYDAQMADFYASHPDMRPMQKPRRPKTLYLEEQIRAELERLATSAGQDPQKEQRRLRRDLYHELHKKYSDQWQKLPDVRKTHWVLQTMQQYNEYLAANPRTAKSMPRLLNANEQKLLAAHRLRPTRPPDNIVRYYMTVCPEDVSLAVEREAAETEKEEGRRKSRVRLYATRWRELTLPEQIKHWRAYYEAVTAYRTAMKEWLSKQSATVRESTIADNKKFEEKTSRSFADVEEYGRQCGYTIMGPAGLATFERHRRKYLTVTHPDDAVGPKGLRRVALEVYAQLPDHKRKPYEEKETEHLSGFASTSVIMRLKRKAVEDGDEATTPKRAKAIKEVDGILLPPEPKKPPRSSYHSFIAHFAAGSLSSNDSGSSSNPAERQKRFGDSVRRWKQLSKQERKRWDERYAAENKQYLARLEAYKKSLTTEQLEAYKRRCRKQAGLHCLQLDETNTSKKTPPRRSVLQRTTLRRTTLQRSELLQNSPESVVYHPPSASGNNSRSSVATAVQSAGQLSRDATRHTGQTETGRVSVYDFSEPHDDTTAESNVGSHVTLRAAAASNATASRNRVDCRASPLGARRTLFTLRSPSRSLPSPSRSLPSPSWSQPLSSRLEPQHLQKSVPSLPVQQCSAPADDAEVARQPEPIVGAVLAASQSQGESRWESTSQSSSVPARSPRSCVVAKAGNLVESTVLDKEDDGREKVRVKNDEELCAIEGEEDHLDMDKGPFFVINVVEKDDPHAAEIHDKDDEVGDVDVDEDADESDASVEDDGDDEHSLKEDEGTTVKGSEEKDGDDEEEEDEEEDLEESREDEGEEDHQDVDEGTVFVANGVEKDDPHTAEIDEKDAGVDEVGVDGDGSGTGVEEDDEQSMEEDEVAKVKRKEVEEENDKESMEDDDDAKGKEDEEEEDDDEEDDDEEDDEEEDDEEEDDEEEDDEEEEEVLEESSESEEEAEDQDVDEDSVFVVNVVENDLHHAEMVDDDEGEESDVAEDSEEDGSIDLLEHSSRWSQWGQFSGHVRTDAASHSCASKGVSSCSQVLGDDEQNVDSDSRRTTNSGRRATSGHNGGARVRNTSGGSIASDSSSVTPTRSQGASCSSQNVRCGRDVASDLKANASQKAISPKASGVRRSNESSGCTSQNARNIGSSAAAGGCRTLRANQKASTAAVKGTGSQNSSSSRWAASGNQSAIASQEAIGHRGRHPSSSQDSSSGRNVGRSNQSAIASQGTIGQRGRHPSSSQNASSGQNVGSSRNFVNGGSAGASQKANGLSLSGNQQSSVDRGSNVNRSGSSGWLSAGHDWIARGGNTSAVERNSQRVLGGTGRQRAAGAAGSQSLSSSQGTGGWAAASDDPRRAVAGSRQQQLRSWLQPLAGSSQSGSPRKKNIVDFFSVTVKPSAKAEQGKAT